MPTPDPYDLDKRLEVLQHTVTQGFESLRQEIQRLSERFEEDVSEIKALSCRNEARLDDIEPFVLNAKATWAIVWKFIVIAVVIGVAWAISESGALLP